MDAVKTFRRRSLVLGGAFLLIAHRLHAQSVESVSRLNSSRAAAQEKRNIYGGRDDDARSKPELTLTAITVLAGTKTAYFNLPRSANDPALVHFSVREGQTKGDVEVLQILERAWDVRVRFRGEDLVLNLHDKARTHAGLAVASSDSGFVAKAERTENPATANVESGTYQGEPSLILETPASFDQIGKFRTAGVAASGANPSRRGVATTSQPVVGEPIAAGSGNSLEEPAPISQMMQDLQAKAQANALEFAARNAAILPLPQPLNGE